MRQRPSLQDRLYRFCQSILTGTPKLVEIRSMANRTMGFLKAWNYLSQAQIQGDYLEFGVLRGTSFVLSMKAAAKYFPKGTPQSPRFFAFDSFEGLPKNDPLRDSGIVSEGDYKASLEEFKTNIRKASKGWDVRIIQGFFDKTLTEELRRTQDMKPCAFVAIDCDIYASTIVALRFITPLIRSGTVIYFDDWYFSGSDMTQGESGACADWLKENPQIQLLDFGEGQIMGRFFLVDLRKD